MLREEREEEGEGVRVGVAVAKDVGGELKFSIKVPIGKTTVSKHILLKLVVILNIFQEN